MKRVIKMTILGKEFEGSYFKQEEDGQTLIEEGFIENLQKKMVHDLSGNSISFQNLHKKYISPLPEEDYELMTYPDVNDLKFIVKIVLYRTGYKKIEINIPDMKCISYPKAILHLMNFFTLNCSINPPIPSLNLNKNNLFYIKKKKGIKKRLPKGEGGMLITFKVENIFIKIPSEFTENCFGFKGVLSGIVSYSPCPLLNEIVNEIKLNYLKYNSVSDLNLVKKIILNLSNLEIVFLNPDNYINKSQKNLVMPFNVFINIKNHLVLNEFHQFYTKKRLEISFDKTLLRNSLMDLKIFQSAIIYLVNEIIGQKPEEEEESFLIEEDGDENHKTKYSLNNYSMKDEKIEGEILEKEEMMLKLISHGVQMIVITSHCNQIIPLCQFEIFQLTFLLNKTPDLSLSTIFFSLSSSYFNMYNSRWEPIIEKTGFNLEINSSFPKSSANLEINENFEILNINISAQFLNRFLQEINESNNERNFNSKNEKFLLKNHENERSSFSSSYAINNETGYSIEILKISSNIFEKNKPFIIENLQKLDLRNETNLDSLFEEIDENKMQNMCKVKICFVDKKFSSYIINNVTLDRVQVKKHRISDSLDNDSNYYSIISNVEIIENKKVLTISSSLLIENLTGDIIQIKISQNNLDNNYEIKVLPNSQYPIPFNLMKSNVFFFNYFNYICFYKNFKNKKSFK